MDHRQDPAFDFKRGQGDTLLIACGALAREIIDLIEMNGWRHLDVTCLPAKLHHDPKRIPEEIRRKIRANKPHYGKIYVLYGDCGTGGLLDKVLEEEGDIERIPGPHCFSFFRGNAAFARSAEDEITTFYLTDYFCRHFETFVWKALGLDRRRDMAHHWVEGILGRIIAVVMVVAGVAIGIARQSIAAFGIGVASALGLVNAPTIVDNIVTATVAQSQVVVDQLPAVLAVIESAAPYLAKS